MFSQVFPHQSRTQHCHWFLRRCGTWNASVKRMFNEHFERVDGGFKRCFLALQETHGLFNWNSKEAVPVRTIFFLYIVDIMSLTPTFLQLNHKYVFENVILSIQIAAWYVETKHQSSVWQFGLKHHVLPDLSFVYSGIVCYTLIHFIGMFFKSMLLSFVPLLHYEGWSSYF